MARRLFVALLLTLTLATGFLAGRVSAAQPHMVAALDPLRLAQKQLDLAEAGIQAGRR